MTDPTSATPTVSVGPFDERPSPRPLLAAIGDVGPRPAADWRGRRAAWLREQLDAAGVEHWAYDDAVIEWLAGGEPETIHVIGGWIARAAASRG